MTWGTTRLDEIKNRVGPTPRLVETLKLGLIDDWGEGWVKKTWEPVEEVLQPDGSMFGGYISALADQILSLVALTVIPEDKAFRTNHLYVSFLKLVYAAPLKIEARVISQSQKIIAVEASFKLEDGTLVATANAQQVITSFPGSTSAPD